MTRNQVAELTLRVKAPLAFDLSSSFESTGRFVLVDEYDIAGGGIITELVHDEQEGLREEARQREYAWLTGDVRAEDRAEQYGHRAAIVLFTGSAQTGKTFLARRVEALLVADSRHAYLLEGEFTRAVSVLRLAAGGQSHFRHHSGKWTTTGCLFSAGRRSTGLF